jgi:hypothetical protein
MALVRRSSWLDLRACRHAHHVRLRAAHPESGNNAAIGMP